MVYVIAPPHVKDKVDDVVDATDDVLALLETGADNRPITPKQFSAYASHLRSAHLNFYEAARESITILEDDS